MHLLPIERALRERGVEYPLGSGLTGVVGEIYVMLTWRCNLRCAMCPMWGSHGFCLLRGPGEESLTVEAVGRFIGEAAPFRPRTITISGGEPLLSPICIPLARSLVERGMRVMLTTNATLLERLAEEDLALFDQINVSLDGPPLVLARMGRGGGETFTAAVNGVLKILKMRKGGRPSLQLITVITPVGAAHLAHMLELFRKEGVHFDAFLFQHQIFCAAQVARRQEAALKEIFGDGVGIWWALRSRPREMRISVLRRQINAIRQICPQAVFSPQLKVEELKSYYGIGSWVPPYLNNYCLSPWFDLGITPSGEVWICPGFSAGNIHQSGFEEIWNGEKARKVRRKIVSSGLFPGCRACFYLYNYRDNAYPTITAST